MPYLTAFLDFIFLNPFLSFFNVPYLLCFTAISKMWHNCIHKVVISIPVLQESTVCSAGYVKPGGFVRMHAGFQDFFSSALKFCRSLFWFRACLVLLICTHWKKTPSIIEKNTPKWHTWMNVCWAARNHQLSGLLIKSIHLSVEIISFFFLSW